MTTVINEMKATVSPTADDIQLAREAGRRLTQLLAAQPEMSLRVQIEQENQPGE